MKIETKFNIGDKAWKIETDNIEGKESLLSIRVIVIDQIIIKKDQEITYHASNFVFYPKESELLTYEEMIEKAKEYL